MIGSRLARHTRSIGHRLICVTAVIVAVLLAPVLHAQPTPAPTAATSPTPVGPADELDRGVPRTMVLGFLKAAREGNDQRAAQYLDLRSIPGGERASAGPGLARHLRVVIDRALWIDTDALSDQPEGQQNDGLPPRRDSIGTIQTSKEPVNVVIERVPREDGVLIWKFSALTVAKIPELYKEFGYGPLGDLLPQPLFEITFLRLDLWQWIGMLLLVVLAAIISWIVARLVVWLLRPLLLRLRDGIDRKLEQLVFGPVRLALGVALFYGGTFLLRLPLSVQALFDGFAKALVILAVTWLAMRVVDIIGIRIEERMVARGRVNAIAVLPLGRRTVKVFLVAIGLLALLQNLGFNVTGVLAGLGVGGLAVALAAQETVKNFFGGIALIADQPVRVGDFCRFGDKVGTIEDISLWSTRVRTPDRTVISVPNGQFAAMQLENFGRRDRIRLHATLPVRRDLTVDQLRPLIDELNASVAGHELVHRGSARARIATLGAASIDIDISAYVLTHEYEKFLQAQEEILLAIMRVIETRGAK